eukprot:1142501-Rhodomonas_salina.1
MVPGVQGTTGPLLRNSDVSRSLTSELGATSDPSQEPESEFLTVLAKLHFQVQASAPPQGRTRRKYQWGCSRRRQ